jgi:hypothetical protein
MDNNEMERRTVFSGGIQDLMLALLCDPLMGEDFIVVPFAAWPRWRIIIAPYSGVGKIVNER